MEDRISLEKLDSAIAEAIEGTDLGRGRLIYGFVPPDWYDFEDAMGIAKKVSRKVGGGVEPAVLKIDSTKIAVLDQIRSPYIVGFIGPIDLRITK